MFQKRGVLLALLCESGQRASFATNKNRTASGEPFEQVGAFASRKAEDTCRNNNISRYDYPWILMGLMVGV